MKKKLLSLIILLVGIVNGADAQVMLGGTAGFAYKNEVSSMAVLPLVGYQINDRWAVGLQGGVEIYDDYSSWVVDPFVRFNVWNNQKFFFDVKAECAVATGDSETSIATGLTPSLRLKLNDHWLLSGDFGTFGAQEIYDEWKPIIGLSGTGVYVSAIYLF